LKLYSDDDHMVYITLSSVSMSTRCF